MGRLISRLALCFSFFVNAKEDPFAFQAGCQQCISTCCAKEAPVGFFGLVVFTICIATVPCKTCMWRGCCDVHATQPEGLHVWHCNV